MRSQLHIVGSIAPSAYSAHPMADDLRAEDAAVMPNPLISAHSHRQPDNELFDRSCELLDAAGALRSAAAAPEAAGAAPAVLGCLEAALHELVVATPALEQISAQAIGTRSHGRPQPDIDERVSRMHRGHANLKNALVDAARASCAAGR
jgi:hypothetical protein